MPLSGSEALAMIRSRFVGLREHREERHNREWHELYERLKLLLLQYGVNDIDDGDYYLVDEE